MRTHNKSYQTAMDAQRFDLKARKRPRSAAEIPSVNFNTSERRKLKKRLTRHISAPELQQCAHYSSSSESSRYLLNADFVSNDAAHFKDVFAHADGSTTTRTVIAPFRPSPPPLKSNLSCMVDSSEESLVTGQELVKPLLSSLNCFKADAIVEREEVVKEMIEDRKRPLGGEGFVISMCVEQQVALEEKWQGHLASEGSGSVDWVSSRVEVR